MVKYKGSPNVSPEPKTRWGVISQKRYRKNRFISKKIKNNRLSPHSFVQKNKVRNEPIMDGRPARGERHRIKLPGVRNMRRGGKYNENT
jgi:hypothetical protein